LAMPTIFGASFIHNILEPTTRFTFFNSGVISFYGNGHSRLPVASIVISKFLHSTILATISAKSFFQQNFNLIPKISSN
jgi:hypothetical protein